MNWKLFKQELKPKSKREWLKFLWDILLLLFLFYMVITVINAFNDGYNAGYVVCKNEMIKNFTDMILP